MHTGCMPFLESNYSSTLKMKANHCRLSVILITLYNKSQEHYSLLLGQRLWWLSLKCPQFWSEFAVKPSRDLLFCQGRSEVCLRLGGKSIYLRFSLIAWRLKGADLKERVILVMMARMGGTDFGDGAYMAKILRPKDHNQRTHLHALCQQQNAKFVLCGGSEREPWSSDRANSISWQASPIITAYSSNWKPSWSVPRAFRPRVLLQFC